MVLVPLALHHELLGWVVLGQKKSGNAFSAQELAFCQITAPQIALGLHHASSYGRTRAFNRRLKKEVQHATQDLIEANLQLSQLDQLKDEFVSIASHELRTPMTAIRSYLWLCLQHGTHTLPENVARHLHIAYDATDRLLALVKELLTVSQLEAGKLSLSLERVRIFSLVRSVIDVLSVSAAEKHVGIELHAEDEEVDVPLDRVKFSEVMQNLIGNAVKFSPSHSHVIVSIKKAEKYIKITVKDQGKGISQEDQKHLFQKFGVVQHQYKTVAQQGTGLGLYIAKQFVQLHSGTIKVRSTPGAGTTFVVVLPLSLSTHNSLDERSHALSLSPLS
jgi:signal transduction histidine kinase